MWLAGAVISIFPITLVKLSATDPHPCTMGRDGMLPATFAKVNRRHDDTRQNTVIVEFVGGSPGRAGCRGADGLKSWPSVNLTAFSVVSRG